MDTTVTSRRNSTKRIVVAALAAALVVALFPTQPAAADDTFANLAVGGGDVHEFGSAAFQGSLADVDLAAPVVAMAAHPDGNGYWLLTKDGGVHSFGGAAHHGDPSDVTLAAPVVDIAPTPSGDGYWLVGSDGGVFAYGDARFHGSAGDIALAAPVKAITPTPDGGGYWLAASDGGVFAYGNAAFHGSAGNIALAAPVVDMLATAGGGGYWLFGGDGGVFAFGDAPFHGSATAHITGGVDLAGAAIATGGGGYYLAASNGAVFAFGTAVYEGGIGASAAEPVADIASTAGGYWLVTTLGSPYRDTPVPANSGSGRRIVYSNSDQRVWLIEADESITATYLISGRRDTPAPGHYEVFSKSRWATAGHDGITMEYMVRFAKGRRLAIGFHSIPTYSDGRPMQSEEQLGTYRSSGCVRQRLDQAQFLYNWAPVGTRVVVLP